MKTIRFRRKALTVALVAAVAILGMRAIRPSGTYFEVTKHLEILTSVFKGGSRVLRGGARARYPHGRGH